MSTLLHFALIAFVRVATISVQPLMFDDRRAHNGHFPFGQGLVAAHRGSAGVR
jgi:hypothetical protein